MGSWELQGGLGGQREKRTGVETLMVYCECGSPRTRKLEEGSGWAVRRRSEMFRLKRMHGNNESVWTEQAASEAKTAADKSNAEKAASDETSQVRPKLLNEAPVSVCPKC